MGAPATSSRAGSVAKKHRRRNDKVPVREESGSDRSCSLNALPSSGEAANPAAAGPSGRHQTPASTHYSGCFPEETLQPAFSLASTRQCLRARHSPERSSLHLHAKNQTFHTPGFLMVPSCLKAILVQAPRPTHRRGGQHCLSQTSIRRSCGSKLMIAWTVFAARQS